MNLQTFSRGESQARNYSRTSPIGNGYSNAKFEWRRRGSSTQECLPFTLLTCVVPGHREPTENATRHGHVPDWDQNFQWWHLIIILASVSAIYILFWNFSPLLIGWNITDVLFAVLVAVASAAMIAAMILGILTKAKYKKQTRILWLSDLCVLEAAVLVILFGQIIPHILGIRPIENPDWTPFNLHLFFYGYVGLVGVLGLAIVKVIRR